MVRVRRARVNEADALTALCIRSKAHWGYGGEFMRRSAASLAVTPAMIAEGRVLVAEEPPTRVLGVAAVEEMQAGSRFDLTLLFVEPAAIGRGIGRVLFNAAASLVATRGGSSLSILADPFAEGFYRHLGAVRIGEAPSDAIPGRYLPQFDYAILSTPGAN
jgi:GNAT superfamily N-acetyltransferase